MEQLLTNSESAPDWELIRPALDEALDSLGDEDREALLLRYFKNQDFRAVGLALGVSDDAAQKRVSRAVERLREFFSKRGITVGAGGLAVLISANAVQSVPVGLVATLASASLTSAAQTGSTISFLKLMATTKFKAGIASAIVLAGAVTSLLIHHQAQARLKEQDVRVQQQAQQLARIKADHERLANTAAQYASGASNPSNELFNLRTEAEQLRSQINDLPLIQEQIRRLKHHPETKPETPLQIREMIWARSSCADAWAVAFIAYARRNQGQLPTSFEQAESFWESAIEKKTGMSADQFETQYGTMTDQFDLVYRGSLGSIRNQNGVILLQDKKPWPLLTGKWGKNFAVVSSEDLSTDRGPHILYCSSSNKTATGNWDDFEQEHSVAANKQ